MLLSLCCFLFIFCKSDKEFFRDDDLDPFVPAPDIFLLDLAVDGVPPEDLAAAEANADLSSDGGDLIDLVRVPFAPMHPPPNDDEADVDVVPETTIDPGLVPGGGGKIIAFTAGFIPADVRPWKLLSVSAEAIIGVAVVVDI